MEVEMAAETACFNTKRTSMEESDMFVCGVWCVWCVVCLVCVGVWCVVCGVCMVCVCVCVCVCGVWCVGRVAQSV